jgi:PqqA peptide cyclase
VIDLVVPDYYARRPKACVGGWGRRSLNVTPSGRVLPCHAAETILGLEFWSVRDHPLAEIWMGSPAFRAFRGTDWMEEPCRSCALREVDFGGCRCQALAIAGHAAAADPSCELSPHHARMLTLAELDAATTEFDYAYRDRPSGVRPVTAELH